MNIMPAVRDFERSPDFELESENQLLLLRVLELNGDCIAVIDSSGFIRHIKNTGRSALGIAGSTDLEGMSLISLWPEAERERVTTAIAVATLGETVRLEAACSTLNGFAGWWDVTIGPLNREVGGEPGVLAILRDVTAHVAKREEVQRLLEQKDEALAERDLLIHEIHHRSKNSLQLVQGLIGIQSRAVGVQSETREQLAQSTARIRTISALHDRLYRSNAGLEVEVRPYLESLVGDIQTSLSTTLSGRQVTFSCDEARWAANDVPALGLVLTELMTNAVKHGAGDISVTFRQSSGGPGIVTVRDHGGCLPDGFNPAINGGLGMKLILSLLQERSGGGLDYSCEDGVTQFVGVMPAASVNVAA